MRVVTTLTFLLFGLAACTTMGESGVRVESASPYSLTMKDKSAVVQGIFATLKDEVNSPSFRDLKGAKGADGTIYVCGWISSKGEGGAYEQGQPFMVSLSAGQFHLDRFPRSVRDPDEIRAACEKLGIKI